MAKIMKIYKDTDPILREKCREVQHMEPWVMNLCDDMWITMQSRNAVGLAANQVGYNYKIIAIHGPEFSGIMINPTIQEKTEEIFHFMEGCLSIPGIELDTGKRSKAISISYFDMGGVKKILWTKDMTAVIIQHEMDHLAGKLMTDYIDKRIM